jgi:hypothetical protein
MIKENQLLELKFELQEKFNGSSLDKITSISKYDKDIYIILSHST